MTTNLPTAAAPTGVALSPDDLALMQGAAAHVQNYEQKDLVTPYLVLVQGMSPYVKRNHPQFVENAHEGDIIDTLTLRLRSEAMVVPVLYELHYTEWKPNRGGLVRQYFTDGSAYKAAEGDYGVKKLPNGNDITETPTFYCLLLEDTGQSMPVVVTMGSTQARKARMWNSLIAMLEFQGPDGPFLAPSYARVYRLTSVSESAVTARGQEVNYAGWKVEAGPLTLELPHGRTIFAKAKAFRESLDRGEGRAAPPAHEAREPAPARTAGPSDPNPPPPDSDEIPF